MKFYNSNSSWYGIHASVVYGPIIREKNCHYLKEVVKTFFNSDGLQLIFIPILLATYFHSSLTDATFRLFVSPNAVPNWGSHFCVGSSAPRVARSAC